METSVEELDHEKLPLLLEINYGSLKDAENELDNIMKIRELFIGFQKHLYQQKAA